jgi:hypothetical protein
MKKVYTVWHLNLAYSSLELSQHKEVIDKCYSPILELAENEPFRFGIELSAGTLERIAELDPHWISRFSRLIQENKVELIGSGFAQIIGPLVPAIVNQMNIRVGIQSYESILGIKPSIFLLNEQVFSTGLLDVYAREGIRAIVMEWENPYSSNQSWGRDLRFRPQLAKGIQDTLPVIWNHSVAFQKLQRMAHGDISINEWSQWFSDEISGDEDYALCIYGGDAETFDFRAKRYSTEAVASQGEWERIRIAFSKVLSLGVEFALPSEVLESSNFQSMQSIDLSNPKVPLPTKKQTKYNPLRWVVGGRDAFLANTTCERIFDLLKTSNKENDLNDWRKLLSLWGSDFRTHITESRWSDWKSQSSKMLDGFDSSSSLDTPKFRNAKLGDKVEDFEIFEEDGYLTVKNKFFECVLNLKRGLAIHSCSFFEIADHPLFGTISHGDLHHIDWNADFYSGEFVVDLPGLHKVTDLEKVKPEIYFNEDCLVISATIETRLGALVKSIKFSRSLTPILTFTYDLKWTEIPPCTMRFGDIVLLPNSFESDSLFVETHNGGFEPDHFMISNIEIEHGKYWSPLISARNCLGVTEGEIVIGDHKKALIVRLDRSVSPLPALLTNVQVIDTQFTRLQFTARELDDTSADKVIKLDKSGRTFEFSIEPVRIMK